MVPTGRELVASMTLADSWHVPLPRPEMLKLQGIFFFSKSELYIGSCATSCYPKAKVWHSLSLRQSVSQIFSEFVSEFRNVFSNGSMAPKAIRSKQSVTRIETRIELVKYVLQVVYYPEQHGKCRINTEFYFTR